MQKPETTKSRQICPLYTILAACALTVSALGFAGCAEPEKFEPVEQICAADLTRAEAMAAAEDVLGRMYFVIDKSDAEAGIIRTRPLAGGQFFEFWRKDNVGSFNSHEANLHTIRRTVRLDISQQANQLCIACSVKTERLSLPARRLVSSTQAHEMFSKSSPAMQVFKLHQEQRETMGWIDLGADARLETEILNRLKNKLEQSQEEDAL